MKKLFLVPAFLGATSLILLSLSNKKEEKIDSYDDHDGKTPLHHLQQEPAMENPSMPVTKAQKSGRPKKLKRSQKVKKSKGSQKLSKRTVTKKPNHKPKIGIRDFRDTLNLPLADAGKGHENKDSKPKTPWLNELSGHEAHVRLTKSAHRKQKCDHEGCGKPKKRINLVGVVIETERISHPTENLVAGDLKVGDAKKLPAFYVK